MAGILRERLLTAENGQSMADVLRPKVQGTWAFFFFFQAEDGIRYIGVTGVQTCALPISGALTKTEYEHGLAAAGFVDVSVVFTHQVGDGLHSAIIKATRPANPTATAAAPSGVRRELRLVQQSGCC